MSWQAIRFVFELPSLAPNGEPVTSTDVAVLAALANRLNGKTMQCNPTIAMIASESKASEPTVHRIIKGLQKKGLLSVERRSIPGVGMRANHYVFVGFNPANYQQPDTPSGVSPDGERGIASDTERGITPRRNNQKVNQNLFNQNINQESVGADAPTTPANKTRNPSVKTDAERAKAVLDQQVKQAVTAITTGLAYTKAQERWLKDDVRPFVEKYGIDDVVGWHRACTAYYSKDTPRLIKMYWATDGIPLWIARGRPTEIPNAQDAAKDQRGGTTYGQPRGNSLADKNADREAAERKALRDMERYTRDPLPLRQVS